jgi:hypothetical protein
MCCCLNSLRPRRCSRFAAYVHIYIYIYVRCVVVPIRSITAQRRAVAIGSARRAVVRQSRSLNARRLWFGLFTTHSVSEGWSARLHGRRRFAPTAAPKTRGSTVLRCCLSPIVCFILRNRKLLLCFILFYENSSSSSIGCCSSCGYVFVHIASKCDDVHAANASKKKKKKK